MSAYAAVRELARSEAGENWATSVCAAIEEIEATDAGRAALLQDQLAKHSAERAETQARLRGEWSKAPAPAPVAPPAPTGHSMAAPVVAPPVEPEPDHPEPARRSFLAAVFEALGNTDVLDLEDKAIVYTLLGFRGARRGIYPSLATIARRASMSRATVKRRLRHPDRRPDGLRDRGVIVVRPGPAPPGAEGDGATYRYVVRHPRHWRLT